ncbi:hypothetical protein HPQ64_05740 [Rhizobiales bacterium]|uniref:hypothetical protein n=1 Tax=Hongsoonwoonella zoysiae TaxID=2821844 RepID=UPI00156040DE|nr:hypothetical protein [Hongsoonwoonella zoysiae]NRG17185.1 hypothetical protein [Hongsoonwoonella zoysiae]
MSNVSSGSKTVPETEIFDEMETWQPWNWAEAADRLEEMMTFGPAEVQRRTLDCAAALFNMQIDFVSKRLHADMDCALRMMESASPADVAGTASSFWGQLIADYENHTEAVTVCLGEHISQVEEIAEEAAELGRDSERLRQKSEYPARRKPRAAARAHRARAA